MIEVHNKINGYMCVGGQRRICRQRRWFGLTTAHTSAFKQLCNLAECTLLVALMQLAVARVIFLITHEWCGHKDLENLTRWGMKLIEHFQNTYEDIVHSAAGLTGSHTANNF